MNCSDQLIPKAVEALKDNRIVLISGGWRHTAAADDTGKLYAWGWNKVCLLTEVAVIHISFSASDLCLNTMYLSYPPAQQHIFAAWDHPKRPWIILWC